MAIVRWFRRASCGLTAAQSETALRLGDSCVGAYVRLHPGGNAEVRTVRKGEPFSFLVRPDGAAELLESRPRTWRYPLGRGLLFLGTTLAVTMVATIVGIKLFKDSRADAGLGWAAALCGIGLIAGFIGEGVLHSQVSRPSGESWERVGGAEF